MDFEPGTVIQLNEHEYLTVNVRRAQAKTKRYHAFFEFHPPKVDGRIDYWALFAVQSSLNDAFLASGRTIRQALQKLQARQATTDELQAVIEISKLELKIHGLSHLRPSPSTSYFRV